MVISQNSSVSLSKNTCNYTGFMQSKVEFQKPHVQWSFEELCLPCVTDLTEAFAGVGLVAPDKTKKTMKYRLLKISD